MMSRQSDPALARALLDQGARLQGEGRLEAAELRYQQALQHDPNAFDALLRLGALHLQTGRAEAGVALIQRAIEIDPRVAEAHGLLAAALAALRRPEPALAGFERAIALQPTLVAAHFNRALLLSDLGRPAEALAGFDHVLQLSPSHARALNHRGSTLRTLGRLEDALADYDAAVALEAGYAAAHLNRGVVLGELKRPELALESLATAVVLAPGDPDAHNNHGLVLHMMRRLDEALACFDQAVALNPNAARFHAHRGLALYEMLRLDEAIASFDQATALDPQLDDAGLNRGFALLLSGRLEAGWPQYEWRKRLFNPGAHRFAQGRPWTGEDNAERKIIYVYNEQGFGDTLQFWRYLQRLEAGNLEVHVSVQAPLRALLQPHAGAAVLVDEGQPPERFDYHCSLLSLPLAFATTLQSIPAQPAYLRADPERAATFQGRLPAGAKPRIGVAWRGSPTHGHDLSRSIGFDQIRPMLSEAAQWISLQKQVRPADAEALRAFGRMTAFDDDLSDFSDTAALIDLLDLVITVDTSVAHLAGALGKPVWILLPYLPDWRWLLDRADSPWYPSARLFRQTKPGDWDGVIEQVAVELAARYG